MTDDGPPSADLAWDMLRTIVSWWDGMPPEVEPDWLPTARRLVYEHDLERL